MSRRFLGSLTSIFCLVAASASAQNGQGANVIPNPAPMPESFRARFEKDTDLAALVKTLKVDTKKLGVLDIHTSTLIPPGSLKIRSGFGTDAYREGMFVASPQVKQKVEASYTPTARAAGIEGDVSLEVVVEADGSVRTVRVVKSLDATHGLDDQAIAAARRWTFEPGSVFGQPIAVVVPIVISFRLR